MSRLDELRATAHPLRLRLLSLLTGAAMSAAEAGRELGVSQASASYHLRVLERAHLVRVVEVVRLRGGEAKRYRHESSSQRFDPDAHLGARSREGEGEYVEAIVDELRRRAALRADGPAISTDAELWVDPAVWRRIVQHIGEASALLHAAARPPRTPGTLPVSMTAALFPVRATPPRPASVPGNPA
ncbi:Helix-turn-helix domain-containing protein [Microbacterium sp. ru370.1]|uniref:winged helix-turn-helix domain-containing protein n=1 Tax=unclassified Microbacterium TaxID=2609290 RepID=UPI000881E0E2|nr:MULTISPECIES: helix-turn-helix domain-containing protein [unclassified Microbacterium]SDO30279.1 Helix-turn-helix domain-containing protein [Microbacterium sp. ru370.1]SIT75945.1 Helix-turn-helix domain-containing protein [Microbacterium sp. RU1D]